MAFATLPDPDIQPPTTPTNFRYTKVYGPDDYPATVTLEWDASTDNTAVTGYKVLIDGNILDIGNSSAYVYTISSRGTSSVYIRAYDAAGNQSQWSPALKVRV